MDQQKEFQKVLKTLKSNHVMVSVGEDGIYIRLAGHKDKGEAFTLEWAKVYSFDESIRNVSNHPKLKT